MATTSIIPVHDRVAIKLAPQVTKSAGGIDLPDSALPATLVGEVVATGDGYKLGDGSWYSVSLRIGSRVIVRRNDGVKVDASGEELLLIREHEVLAVLV